jgi:hypothetical protein
MTKQYNARVKRQRRKAKVNRQRAKVRKLIAAAKDKD